MTMTESNTLPPSIELLRKSLLAAYYALLFYFVVNAVLVFGEFRLASAVIWFIQVAPLLIFRPRAASRPAANLWLGVLRYTSVLHARRAYRLRSARLWLGVVEVLLCTIIFVLLILFIRQYRDHYKVPL